MGRKSGSRNKGYFYRAGRGWFATVDGKFIPLSYQNGVRMRDKHTPAADVKTAYNGLIADGKPVSTNTTVLEVCTAYLAKAKDTAADQTFTTRANTLFDFCFGLPPRFRESKVKPKPSDKIHGGYGGLPVSHLKPLHVDAWLQAHPTWKGGRRTHIQALKRAFNYGVECGLIPTNPLKGYKVAKQNARTTYLTPEQEQALIDNGNSAIAMAIKVCIRTGARPGCEFAKLTAAHIKDHGERMEWIFQPQESKTKILRTIRITDPEIIEIVRKQIKKYRKGPIFRNTKGDVWIRESLSLAFRKLKNRLAQYEFDDDCCMYSCRHTYAKRILQGYWTGRQTNIENLARLMGNSSEVCRDHYLQWTDTYNEPLWASV